MRKDTILEKCLGDRLAHHVFGLFREQFRATRAIFLYDVGRFELHDAASMVSDVKGFAREQIDVVVYASEWVAEDAFVK